jgi:hypothetical protein
MRARILKAGLVGGKSRSSLFCEHRLSFLAGE